LWGTYICLLPSPFTTPRILFALSILFIGLLPFSFFLWFCRFFRSLTVHPLFYYPYLFHYSNLLFFYINTILHTLLRYSIFLYFYSSNIFHYFFNTLLCSMLNSLIYIYLLVKLFSCSLTPLCFCNLYSRSFPFVFFLCSVLLFSFITQVFLGKRASNAKQFSLLFYPIYRYGKIKHTEQYQDVELNNPWPI
jgi:hypothetical protein